MARVFVDGQAGSTGLEISQRLAERDDIELIRIKPEHRKNPQIRAQCLNNADISILCLPDQAARQAVTLVDPDIRLIDASSAHRTQKEWVYGLAELNTDQRQQITSAKRISNPGCYATGAIAIIAPLVRAGLIQPDHPLNIHAISGYSGGGKNMIAEFSIDTAPASRLYALDIKHKHIPEIMRHSGLTKRPVFSPMVGKFERGMIVCVPIHPKAQMQADLNTVVQTLATAYQYENTISVNPCQTGITSLNPQYTAGSDLMDLHITGDDDTAMICTCLDNLGKGAAGAAIQNLNLALGLPENRSLRLERP